MTILGLDGRPATEHDDAWRAKALMQWLSDRKIRELCVAQKVYDVKYLGMVLGPILDEILRGVRRVDSATAAGLRANMLRILQVRLVRRAIAAKVYVVQRQNHREYEAEMERWRAAGMPNDPPEEPTRPQRRSQVAADLRREFEQLQEQARSEALIVRLS